MLTTEVNNFNWTSTENILLYNPRIPTKSINTFKGISHLSELKSHFIIASSGTSVVDLNDLRWIVLSKEAVLTSAKSVNKLLDATSNDVWINVLPCFHVGGLSILARAFLSNSKVINLYSNEDFKKGSYWNPNIFLDKCRIFNPTLCSLVPTQLHDLVTLAASAPPSLRAVFIGGSALSNTTYQRAIDLGWKLILTYGMTETASQIASSQINNQDLFVLPHIEVKSLNKRLHFRGPSLLTGYLTKDGIIDPKIDSWFESNDLAELIKRGDKIQLNFLGRATEHIKISGELVSLEKLDRILESIRSKCNFRNNAVILPIPDDRLGNKITLVIQNDDSSSESSLHELISDFNKHVLPFERIQVVNKVDLIPYNELGKLQRLKLTKMIIDQDQ